MDQTTREVVRARHGGCWGFPLQNEQNEMSCANRDALIRPNNEFTLRQMEGMVGLVGFASGRGEGVKTVLHLVCVYVWATRLGSVGREDDCSEMIRLTSLGNSSTTHHL